MYSSIDDLKIIRLHRAHAALESAFNQALAEVGLSAPQWDILRLLQENPGASGADIARYAKVTPQAVATMLQRLEAAELVTRKAHGHGRSVGAYLTPQGEALLQVGHQVAAQVEARMMAGFSEEEQKLLEQLLDRCFSNLD